MCYVATVRRTACAVRPGPVCVGDQTNRGIRRLITTSEGWFREAGRVLPIIVSMGGATSAPVFGSTSSRCSPRPRFRALASGPRQYFPRAYEGDLPERRSWSIRAWLLHPVAVRRGEALSGFRSHPQRPRPPGSAAQAAERRPISSVESVESVEVFRGEAVSLRMPTTGLSPKARAAGGGRCLFRCRRR